MQLFLWLAGGYAVICLLGILLHRHFIYFPDPERVAPAATGLNGVEEIEIKSADGPTLVAWYAPPADGQPIILYFHGNAGNAASRADKIETMRGKGHGVLLLNNRGYGGSGGSPSEAANVRDAQAAYDYLIDRGLTADDIILYGESLGSGQTVQLAGRKPVKAVILEAPLTSTIAIARSTYWFLPLRLVLIDQYRNIDQVGAVRAPLLLLHGKRDEVIPYTHSQRIFEAANGQKRLELFPDASHSNLFDHGAWDAVLAFLDDLPGD